MGKHKEKKEKKHKKDKKHKKEKKKPKEYSSSDDSTCTEDEWVEKPSKEEPKQREDWLSLPANFLTASNKEIKEMKNEAKQEQKLNDQYNPSTSVRELNPYWKDNGTGLPSAMPCRSSTSTSSSGFKKPTFNDDDEYDYGQKSSSSSINSIKRTSSWKKTKDSSIKQSEPSSSRSFEMNNDDFHSKSIKNSEKSSTNKQIDDENKVLSQKELNALAAKLVKAEIMGNTSLMKELQAKLDSARNLRAENPEKAKEEDIILTQTDSKGYSRPLKSRDHDDVDPKQKSKKRRVDTHADGERNKYFADDDKYNLKQMFEHEKFNTAEKQNEEFLSILGKSVKNDDLDEIFTDKIRNHEKDGKQERRERDKTISEHSRMTRVLDNCTKCPSSDAVRKHLIISLGTTAYLSLPAHEPLTDGHCQIVPTRHTICSTQLDENEWEEIMDFRKAVTQMCASRGEDVIFFEVARHLHRFPHMVIEAVPMDKEIGDLAPIYFKKAIDESEHEWATNRKLVKLEGRNVRKAVPKGLPYFFVSFGMQEGFAHVIEDEEAFPVNFAQEIIGGMLDLHHSRWRNPKRQSFQQQSDRVKDFSRNWKRFDFCAKT